MLQDVFLAMMYIERRRHSSYFVQRKQFSNRLSVGLILNLLTISGDTMNDSDRWPK